MEMSDQEKLDVKNAMDGKLSDDYNNLEIVLQNLTAEKSTAKDHGRYKRIDKAIGKVQMKMNALKG